MSPRVNKRIARIAALLGTLIAVAACDMNGVPRVAGTYTGNMTMQIGTVLARLPMRLTVEQSGTQVTVSGSVTYQGYTWGFPPAMSGTIDATGTFTAKGIAGGLVGGEGGVSHECGRVGGGYFTLTFSDNEAHLNMFAQTSFCGSMSIDATLMR